MSAGFLRCCLAELNRQNHFSLFMAPDKTSLLIAQPGPDHGKARSLQVELQLPATANPPPDESLKQTEITERTTARSLSLSFRKEEEQEEKSDEEQASPRKRRGGWKTMPFIIANESCEKLASFGLTANMIIYLTKKFNKPNVNASNIIYIWSGCSCVSPVLGAFLSDSYIGRYWTIFLGCIASFIGMALFTSTAIFPKLRPAECSGDSLCERARASAVQNMVLYSSLALMTIGAGGIRPCSIAFGADQFDYKSDLGRKSMQSFFNWYYFSFTIAVMVSVTVVVYIQTDISWSLGLAIPSSLMLLATICFFLGKSLYIQVKPEGSPFTGFAQVLVAAFRKRHLQLPSQPSDSGYYGFSNSALPLSHQFTFLNKAATIIAEEDKQEKVDGWKLCSVEQVEELKTVLRIVPVWAASILLVVTNVQFGTFSVLQANTMDRRLTTSLGKSSFAIPAGSFGIFSMLSLTFFLPVYDKLLVPYTRKLTKDGNGITQLQRIGIGQVLAIIPMISAALVESRRRHVAVADGLLLHNKLNGQVPMSAMWLLPQYCIVGLAEAFSAIGYNELLYRQFPHNMRSVAGALFVLSSGIGNFLSSFLVSLVNSSTSKQRHGHSWLDQNLNQARLDLFYWLLAALTLLNLLYFLIVARWYTYRPNPSPMPIHVHREKSPNANASAQLNYET